MKCEPTTSNAGGIPEYINALEDAQHRAKRTGDNGEYNVTDTTLLLIASTAMLKTQQSRG